MSQTDGTASITFMDNAIVLLRNNWITTTDGNLPKLSLQWNVKAIGVGASNYDEVLISFDSENPQIYSLLTGAAEGLSNYDWLHDVSITIDIRTGKSSNRVLQMMNAVMRIFKTNVVTIIDGTEYIQILPEGVTVLNEDYRNMFRVLVSVSALRFNP